MSKEKKIGIIGSAHAGIDAARLLGGRPVPGEFDSRLCQAGCKHFSAGEIKHNEHCIYYPESYTRVTDRYKTQADRLSKAMEEINQIAFPELMVKGHTPDKSRLMGIMAILEDTADFWG